MDPVAIPNWYRIDSRLTSSGQPSEAQLADLAAIGVRHVVNLAPHSHRTALPDEAASVHQLGMAYTNIPVDFANPTEDDFDAFCTTMAAIGADPVHVHCGANYRVAAFLYRWRRDVLGVPEPEARADRDRVWPPDPIWTAFVEPT